MPLNLVPITAGPAGSSAQQTVQRVAPLNVPKTPYKVDYSAIPKSMQLVINALQRRRQLESLQKLAKSKGVDYGDANTIPAMETAFKMHADEAKLASDTKLLEAKIAGAAETRRLTNAMILKKTGVEQAGATERTVKGVTGREVVAGMDITGRENVAEMGIEGQKAVAGMNITGRGEVQASKDKAAMARTQARIASTEKIFGESVSLKTKMQIFMWEKKSKLEKFKASLTATNKGKLTPMQMIKQEALTEHLGQVETLIENMEKWSNESMVIGVPGAIRRGMEWSLQMFGVQGNYTATKFAYARNMLSVLIAKPLMKETRLSDQERANVNKLVKGTGFFDTKDSFDEAMKSLQTHVTRLKQNRLMFQDDSGLDDPNHWTRQ